MLTGLDHALTALITLVLPAYDVLLWHASHLAGGRLADDRIASYKRTALAEWVVAAVLLAAWVSQTRTLGAIGLGMTWSLGFFGSLAAGLFIVTLLTWQRSEILLGLMDIDELKEEMRPAEGFLPRNPSELKWFVFVSATAGICEEIFFRGFLLWYLTALIPLGWAVAASSILFGMAHAYQGTRGIVTNALVALPLAGFALWSGSLWIPMLVHGFVNVNSGLTAYFILRDQGNRASG